MDGNRLAEKTAGWLQRAMVWLYGLLLGGSLLVCLLLSHISFSRKELTTQFLPAFMLLAFGLLFIFGFYRHFVRLSELEPGRSILVAAAVLIFSIQIFAAWQYWFYTAWDVPVVSNTAKAIAHGEDPSEFYWYFSEFPNNLTLVWIFSVFYRIVHFFGLHEQEYFALICIQCLLNSMTGLLLAQVVHRLFDNKALVVLGYSLYVFLAGISPWVSVPYSDSMGLPFPLIITAIFVNRKIFRFTWVPWMCMAAAAVIGYNIKPQIMIAFIAALILGALGWLKGGFNRDNLRRLAIGVCGILIGVFCSFVLCKAAVRSMNFPVDRECAFQAPHFFMMGMNTETMGTYYSEDNIYSASFSTASERNHENINRAMERIKEMGPVGLAKLLVRKTLTNYYDGTFAWSGEGAFFSVMNDSKENPFCDFFRGLYYCKEYADIGKYYPLWSNFAQMIWLTVLFFAIMAVFAPEYPEKHMMLLSITGLTIFELLFEARARYLFTYVPVYIILALYGFQFIKSKAERNVQYEP